MAPSGLLPTVQPWIGDAKRPVAASLLAVLTLAPGCYPLPKAANSSIRGGALLPH